MLALVACLLLAVAAVFAAIVAANPARPPMAGLDRAWGSLIRPTRDAVLTDVAKVLSDVAGPTRRHDHCHRCRALPLVRAQAQDRGDLPGDHPGSSRRARLQLIKHLVMRARPSGGLVAADAGSFPSGHVITILAVALALTLVLVRPGRRRRALAAVAVATLVMILCRTYLGVHWLSDTLESIAVAGGIVLGLWAILGLRIEREAGTQAGPCQILPLSSLMSRELMGTLAL